VSVGISVSTSATAFVAFGKWILILSNVAPMEALR